MRILIPDIWVYRTYIHDFTATLRSRPYGHSGLSLFWRGPTDEDLFLWMWPEGFFRHSMGGRLGHLTLKQCETFESTLSQWKAKVPVMGVLPFYAPLRSGQRGSALIALYRHLVQHSDGVIHQTIFVGQLG